MGETGTGGPWGQRRDHEEGCGATMTVGGMGSRSLTAGLMERHGCHPTAALPSLRSGAFMMGAPLVCSAPLHPPSLS